MGEAFSAFVRAARDLLRGDLLWLALWPPLAAFALWSLVLFVVWGRGVAAIAGWLPDLPWTPVAWLEHWAAVFLLLALFAALVYLSSLLLMAVFVLPTLVERIAARDYPDLVRHGQNAFWGSLGNSLLAVALFALGWIVILPLLLVPGLVLVLPPLWTGWLNQRVFRFDALAEHATRAEIAAVAQDNRVSLLVAGLGSAAAAHVPVVNFLAPAFAALTFVHLCLAALRRQRGRHGVEI